MKGHCIICGKEYEKWKWFSHHYNKEHPNNTNFIRVKEIWDVMTKEAEMFINTPRMSWI